MQTQAESIFCGFFQDFRDRGVGEGNLGDLFRRADQRPGRTDHFGHDRADHGDADDFIRCVVLDDPDFSDGLIMGIAPAVGFEKCLADRNVKTL